MTKYVSGKTIRELEAAKKELQCKLKGDKGDKTDSRKVNNS